MCQCSECHIAVDKLIPGLLILILFIPHLRDVEDLTRSICNFRPKIGVEVHDWCGYEQGNCKTKKGGVAAPLCQLSDLHKGLVGTNCLVDKTTNRTLRIRNHLLQRSNKVARILSAIGVLLITRSVSDVHQIFVDAHVGDRGRVHIKLTSHCSFMLVDNWHWIVPIGRAGLEPARAYAQQILSLGCLPIPPPPLVMRRS